MAQLGYIICESPSTVEDAKLVASKGNRVIAQGTLQDVDVLNRNSRIYTAKDLFPELTCARTKELLESGNMKGENGHPMSKELSRQQTIDPNNTVVKYLKFWTEGSKVKALFKGCNNQLGEDFNNDLLDDEKPSFSLRALGGIEMRGGKAYVKNVKLITYDRVIYPSHKVAYTEKIVSESALMQEAQRDLKHLSDEAIRRATDAQTKLVVQEGYKGLLAPITNESVIRALQHESANVKALLDNFDVRYNNIEIIPTVTGCKVQMMDEAGNVIVSNLEKYISDEIMNYCAKNY